jgi:hypothetical protein
MTTATKTTFNADNLWKLFNSNNDAVMTKVEGPIAKSCVSAGKSMVDKMEFTASVAKLGQIEIAERLAEHAVEAVENNEPTAGSRVTSFFKMVGQGALAVLAFLLAPIIALVFMAIGASVGAAGTGGFYGLTLFKFLFEASADSASDAFSKEPESYKQAKTNMRQTRDQLRDELQQKLDASPTCAVVSLQAPKSTFGVKV